MKLETALEKEAGRTITELMSATGMSRGGVLQALRRNKSKIKIVGSKREHERGPESKLYALKKGKTFTTNKRSRKAKETPADPLVGGIAQAVEGALAGAQAEAAAVVADAVNTGELPAAAPVEAAPVVPSAVVEPTAATAAEVPATVTEPVQG